MHVLGHGDPVTLAQTLHDALTLSKTPFAAASSSSQPSQMDLDAPGIDQMLGAKGNANNGVLLHAMPRMDKVEDAGMPVPPALGAAIAINFQPAGGGKAAITGDFVLTAQEVNPVLQALRENGIEVAALHNHMLDDQPRFFFMHFWANDDAAKLAKGLRTALDKANVARR